MTDHTAEIALLRAEVVGCAAHNAALETVLFGLLVAMEMAGLIPKAAISNVFDAAAQHITTHALRIQGKDQKTPSGEPHTLAALRIIEELRTQFEKS